MRSDSLASAERFRGLRFFDFIERALQCGKNGKILRASGSLLTANDVAKGRDQDAGVAERDWLSRCAKSLE